MPQNKTAAQAGTEPQKYRHSFLLAVIYALVWLVLTEAEPASWIIGVPAVLIAVAISLVLAPQGFSAVNPAGMFLFIPYFLVLSLKSGVDVLLRTFSPVPRIKPGIFTYQTTLQGSARVMLANVISLLPGTLTADLQEEKVTIHVLDTDLPVMDDIRSLEKRIGAVFLRQNAKEER